MSSILSGVGSRNPTIALFKPKDGTVHGTKRYFVYHCPFSSQLKKGRLFVTFLTMSPATQAITVTKTGCKTLTVTVIGTSLLPPGTLRCLGGEACVPL